MTNAENRRPFPAGPAGPAVRALPAAQPRMRRHRLRKTRISLAALGVLLVAGAGVTRFVVLPAVAKLPANSNTTNVYAGKVPVMLDAAALKPGSTAPPLLHDLPFQVTESVRVLRSNGSDAVVDYKTVQTAGGTALPPIEYHYQLSRTNLGPASSLPGAGVTTTKGLTVSFPIGTQPHDYTGWVQATGRTTQLHYTGTATSVNLAGKTYDLGFKAYVFEQTSPPAPLTDRQQLAMFPSGIAKAQLPQIALALHLPASQLNALAADFAKFPDTVPLAYAYSSSTRYWVAPADGLVVDLQATETYTVELPASVTGTVVPIATVAQFTYTDTPATLAARTADAKHDAWQLGLVRTTLPLIGLVVGVVLIAVATLLRPRRPTGRAAAGGRAPAEAPPPPVRHEAA